MAKLRARSLKVPTFLFVAVLVATVTLTVLWNIVLVLYYLDLQALSPIPRGGTFHWTFITVGSVLFLVVIVFTSLLGAQLIGQIRMSRRQSNFIASVTHELNSPLSAIKLSAQTLRDDSLDPADRRRFVDRVLDDVERLKRLIANILRAAELDNRKGGLEVDRQRVDLYELLQEFVAHAALTRERGQSTVEIELSGGPGLCVALDSVMFRQVLDNLVDNAVRYRQREPVRVRLELVDRGEWAELRVSDEGIGVPAEELRRVFDRFYRIDDGDLRRRRKGTGIGLFIVRSIVQAHEGRVEAVSPGVGGGTTMVIQLPLLSQSRLGEGAE